MTNITPAAIELVRAIRLRMAVDQDAAVQSALDAYAKERLDVIRENYATTCKSCGTFYGLHHWENCSLFTPTGERKRP